MPPVAHAYTAAERRRRILAIVAASSGNLVEWFDFYVYAFSALYFAPAFFPKADPTAQLLDTAGVFAAGFLVRPIGGWLFGRIADRYGRKRSLVASVAMMCAGSLAIACLPTYASIGAAAPALLLVARLVQGLSVGGEYGATATYMSEVALRGRRGFYSSFQYVTLIGGQLLAVVLLVLLAELLGEAELKAWGWRIPFVVGAVTALVALALRRTLHETQNDASRGLAHAGSIRGLLRDHLRPFLAVVGYTAGGSLYFYTFTTYMQKYLVNTVGLPIKRASSVMSGALLVFMALQPAFGALSDRIGRRSSMLAFSLLAVIAVVPLFDGLARTRDAGVAFVLIIAALGILSIYSSVAGIVKAEMFPAEVRALGVGLAYAIGNATFGGTAEYVALSLKAAGHESLYAWYVTLVMLVVLAISWRLPRAARYLAEDEHPSRAPLVLIAAVARNGVMGRGGQLPWDLPEDRAHFHRETMGHAVIMGRRSWDETGRALPGRRNIVVSRSGDVSDGDREVVGSLEEAIALARTSDPAPFVIGGAEIFRLALPLATKLVLTEVELDADGDTRFPDFDRAAWRVSARRAGDRATYVTYERA